MERSGRMGFLTDADLIAEACDPLLVTTSKSQSFHEAFHEAVREYAARPKVFSKVALDDLVEYWRPKYVIRAGAFEVVTGGEVDSRAEAQTDMPWMQALEYFTKDEPVLSEGERYEVVLISGQTRTSFPFVLW